ncbi:MAG: cation diffusion facilitator family transporter [Bacteroidales bacterium]
MHPFVNQMAELKNTRQQQASRVTWIGFFSNLLLTLLKFAAGFLGNSAAMIADAIHSVSDFVTDLVVVGSLKVSSRPSDSNHKYGHGKVETLATAFVGIVLFGIGAGIFWAGLNNVLAHYGGEPLRSPGMFAFWAALASIIVKEILFQYTLKVGKDINSQVVIANAWHHRSDVYSSIATVLGIGGAIFLGENWVILDPVAAMLVSVFIFKVAFSITRESLLELIETALPHSSEVDILNVARRVEGVHNPHDLKTRKIGNNIAIDLHINVQNHLNVEQAHEITVDLENQLRHVYGEETFISIHTEPLK